MIKRFLLCVGLLAAFALSLPAQDIVTRPPLPFTVRVPSDGSGRWLIEKKHPVTFKGLTDFCEIEFSVPVDSLPAGSFVQFGVSLENTGPKAPKKYVVKIFDGSNWRSEDDCTFVTVDSEVRHPSVFHHIFTLQSPVTDTLRVRCIVNNPMATDGSRLSPNSPDNKTALKSSSYVGAVLRPLGESAPTEVKSILLIGNSFTYYFGEPFILQELAFSQGLQLDMHSSLKGGQTFRQHCGLEMTGLQIASGPSDYVIIQGQSQEPAQWAQAPCKQKDVKKSFLDLCAKIRSASPDARIFVENTWSYPAVDNGGFASEEQFLKYLHKGSVRLAKAAHAEYTPVGQAFKAAREAYPELDILAGDSKHPGLAGAYLKACVTLLTLTGRPFSADAPACGLPEQDAAALRAIAEQTVLR